jgi:FAD/FMN-containing dehydrogenase
MKTSRRIFLKTVSLAALSSDGGCRFRVSDKPSQVLVNDVHTQLNPTLVREISTVRSLDALGQIVRRARRERRPISVAGGRHAAGGQQFAADVELIDTRKLNRILHFDSEAGTIEVESGIQWPELMGFLLKTQGDRMPAWAIAQKQTGTDRLSIGGALAANAHGRGLRLPPFISNVESFMLVDANGNCHVCSRSQNPELFKLVIGGYGLFGIVYSVKLRLVPRRRVRRVVKLLDAEELLGAFAGCVRDGFLYGDFQFAVDSMSDAFLRQGILSCYEPVSDESPIPAEQRKLSAQDWKDLLYLVHVDPTRAFEKYVKHYLATSGQIYWSDTQYVSDYFEDYHRELDAKLGAKEPATEVIGELFVPRETLPRFLTEAREDFSRSNVVVIYGTIRLIEQDNESFLAWAKQSYACVIFNIHTPHTSEGVARTANAFRHLIDMAIEHGGSFYLTYHKYATREQLEACYPQFAEFLRLKLKYDPNERFQSDWYRHYKKMFAGG